MTDEYSDVFTAEVDEDGPILSPTHPIKIMWGVEEEVPTSRAWVVPCEVLSSSDGSMETSMAAADPMVDELR